MVRAAYIVDVVRTASGRGKPGGALADMHPVDLLSLPLAAVLQRCGVEPGEVDDVIVGCVTQIGGQSQNIARNALLAAGYPVTVPGTTIDRQCGSGQQAVTFAAQGIMAGAYDVVVAGGVEMMSGQPIGSNAAGRDPYGHGIAHRFAPGLIGQGVSADLIAARHGIGREEMDAYAARSHQRAAAVAARGGTAAEILPVTVPDGRVIDADETIRPATTPESLAALPTPFANDADAARFPEITWSVTAGSSSPLTDGAGAALIVSEEALDRLGLVPRARILSSAVVGSDPIEMLTGVIPATERLLGRAGLGVDEIDAFEVNEAFASVPLAWQRATGVDAARLNPRGGAIALGHPLGASGIRLLASLLAQLDETGGRLGVQTMCEGAGMANALLLERVTA